MAVCHRSLCGPCKDPTSIAPSQVPASLTLQLRLCPGHAVWEMFYCQTAYEGLIEAQICVGVCDGTLRPEFDDTCPMPYQGIATSCWAQNPAER